MSRRRVPMVLAALILGTGAFAAPAAAAADSSPSPGCQWLKSFGTVNGFAGHTLSPIEEFYAGEVVTVTASDFQYDTDIVHVNAAPFDAPYPELGWGIISATHPTLSWEVTETGRWAFFGISQPTVENQQWPGTADFTYTCDTLVLSAFEAPVDAAPVVNLAQAGRTIPFKFTVTDNEGAPVTDLTTNDVAPVTDLSAGTCGTTANVSVIEAYSSGAGTLTHLGNGQYLYTLKTDKVWRGTCGTLGVSVRGVEQTADFQFRS